LDMKINTRLAVNGASLLALGGGGLAVFTSALPASAQTTPAPDTVQDQSGDQSGPNDTTGPDTPETGGAPEAPGATGAAA